MAVPRPPARACSRPRLAATSLHPMARSRRPCSGHPDRMMTPTGSRADRGREPRSVLALWKIPGHPGPNISAGDRPGWEAAMAPFAALLAVVLAWGLVSQRLARYSITLPIVLVAIGAVLSATHVVVVELDTEAVRTLVELALSI